MKLSVEELMRPRYEVIADYPFSKFNVGEILYRSNYVMSDEYYFSNEDVSDVLRNEIVAHYPHLFKPLQWWERREPEELPWYIKHGPNGKPRKVETYNLRFGFVIFEGGRKRNLKPDWLPITESEYSSYKQSIKS